MSIVNGINITGKNDKYVNLCQWKEKMNKSRWILRH